MSEEKEAGSVLDRIYTNADAQLDALRKDLSEHYRAAAEINAKLEVYEAKNKILKEELARTTELLRTSEMFGKGSADTLKMAVELSKHRIALANEVYGIPGQQPQYKVCCRSTTIGTHCGSGFVSMGS